MIAAFISATVALLIFAWTQWVTGLRSRHDLLRSKLEELCRVAVNLRGKTIKASRMHLPDNVDEQREVLVEMNQGVVDDVLMIQMLASIYFPSLRTRVTQVAQAAESSIGRREFFETGSDRPTSFQILVNSQAFNSLAISTHELLDYVNLEYASLTETPWAKVSLFCSRIFS
jgi:hypothetical protein